MIDLKQMRYFSVLAEELHFGRAAARLNIVQPALSMQIKAMEAELATPLLIRSSHSVRLTGAGELLYREAVQILGRTRASLDLVRRAGQGEIGRLRIGASASATASGILAQSLRRFSMARPMVDVSLRESHPVTQPQALLTGDIDLAFGLPDAFAGSGSRVVAHSLARFPIELAVAAHHPLAARDSVETVELREETFIGLSEAEEYASVWLTRATLGYEPDHSLRARSQVMLMTMVEAGLGVAVVSAALRGSAGHIRFLPIRDSALQFDLQLFRRGDEADPVVLDFWQLACEEAAPEAV